MLTTHVIVWGWQNGRRYFHLVLSFLAANITWTRSSSLIKFKKNSADAFFIQTYMRE